jgi:FHS family glucose/mannose:H+ symporter-like MFS transporter
VVVRLGTAEGGQPATSYLKQVERGRKTEQLILYAGFVLTGVVTPILGPLLPHLSAALGLDDAQAGVLFVARFVGSLAGLAVFAFLTRRVRLKSILLAGFGVTAAGVLATAVPSFAAYAGGFFAQGLGLSLTIPPINIYVAELNADRRARALNLLNFAWGIGAVASAPVVDGLARWGLAAGLGALSAAVVLVAMPIARFPFEGTTPADTQGQPAGRDGGAPAFIALTAGIAFFYIGADGIVSGWIGTYLLRQPGAPAGAATIAITTFYGALLAGRLVAALVMGDREQERLALGCGVLALVASAAIPAGLSWPAIVVAASLAGLGFSVIFPTTLATFSKYAGAAALEKSWIVFACANLGGASLPWLVGAIAERQGSLGVGLLVAPAACAVMVILQWMLLRAVKR